MATNIKQFPRSENKHPWRESRWYLTPTLSTKQKNASLSSSQNNIQKCKTILIQSTSIINGFLSIAPSKYHVVPLCEITKLYQVIRSYIRSDLKKMLSRGELPPRQHCWKWNFITHAPLVTAPYWCKEMKILNLHVLFGFKQHFTTSILPYKTTKQFT